MNSMSNIITTPTVHSTGGLNNWTRLRLALSKGPHRVGATRFPLFYLKTEAEPASETLFLKKRTLDDR
jgi:hypothetical protein